MPSLAKDFHRLYKRIGRLSDGQASLADVRWDDDALTRFSVIIQPNSGYFKGGSYKFEMRNLTNYNDGANLDVLCRSKIYHPNIDPTIDSYIEGEGGNVCLNILDYGVNSNLDTIVVGLLFLLNNPNFDDPLSPLFDSCMDETNFAKTVQNWINGEVVEGLEYGTELELEQDVSTENDDIDSKNSEEQVSDDAGNVNNDTCEPTEQAEIVDNTKTAEVVQCESEVKNNEETSTTVAADGTDLNTKIEAFIIAEDFNNEHEDDEECEDCLPTLLTLDGEVFMTFDGLTVEPAETFAEESNSEKCDEASTTGSDNDHQEATGDGEGETTENDGEKDQSEITDNNYTDTTSNIDGASTDPEGDMTATPDRMDSVQTFINIYNKLYGNDHKLLNVETKGQKVELIAHCIVGIASLILCNCFTRNTTAS